MKKNNNEKIILSIKENIFNIIKSIWKKKLPIIIIFIILSIFILLFNIFTSKKLWQTIPTGHVGIVFKNFGGGLSDKIIGVGNNKLPFNIK